mgnify:CR=1 FL=1
MELLGYPKFPPKKKVHTICVGVLHRFSVQILSETNVVIAPKIDTL